MYALDLPVNERTPIFQNNRSNSNPSRDPLSRDTTQEEDDEILRNQIMEDERRDDTNEYAPLDDNEDEDEYQTRMRNSRSAKIYAATISMIIFVVLLQNAISDVDVRENIPAINRDHGLSLTWRQADSKDLRDRFTNEMIESRSSNTNNKDTSKSEQIQRNSSNNSSPNQEEEQPITFEEYLNRFDKSYISQEEYEYRKNIYDSNVKQIQEHNEKAPQHGWIMGINQFADMLPHEIHKGFDKGSLHGPSAQKMLSSSQNHHSFDDLLEASRHESMLRRQLSKTTLPDFVDWRARHPRVTTPVKDQGMCGSCWAFAATAVLESHAALASDQLLSLSPQELVSCAPNPDHCGGNGGCTGSTGELAYEYVASHGMVSEWAYGYTSYHGETGTCQLKEEKSNSNNQNLQYLVGSKVGLVGYSSLPTNSYDALMYAVAELGPVVVSVAASGWGLYKGGILDDFETSDHYDINHAVVLEGYGTDEDAGQDYWLVRNSWGVLWGEDGYIRLKRVDPSKNGKKSDKNPRCKTDITPSHGVACTGPDGNATIPDQLVCGTSGILYANVVPVGAHLL